jgi:hypothetical protein
MPLLVVPAANLQLFGVHSSADGEVHLQQSDPQNIFTPLSLILLEKSHCQKYNVPTS